MKFQLIFLLSILVIPALFAGTSFQKDTLATSAGNLEMTFIGHASLMFRLNELVIHIDPSGREADYTTMPKADILFITHHHGDHLDPVSAGQIRTEKTKIVIPEMCAEKIEDGIRLNNGDSTTIADILIEAVPAYNLVHKRDDGNPYHRKGEGNGYVLTIGDRRIYIAGDTENIPGMKALKNIDVAFLPMNIPYTMTPEMVADAAKAFRPKILYPYHYGDTETGTLTRLLKDETDIEIRIRDM